MKIIKNDLAVTIFTLTKSKTNTVKTHIPNHNNKMESFWDNLGTEYQLNDTEYCDGLSWFFPEDVDVTYTQIECNVKPENIGRLVGEKGRAFNAITRCAGVNYLWIDNVRNVIEIWGPENRLEDAKQRLIHRMYKIEAN